MASSGPSPFKRTMLIDFTLKPTANEPSTWMQLDEQHRFKCGVKDNVKLYDPTSTGRPPSTIYLLSLYPKRKGFVIYQVHYAVMPRSPTKRMVRRDRLKPNLLTLFTADDEANLESKEIRVWIYLSDVVGDYCHQPVDRRLHDDLWLSAQEKLFTDVELVVGERVFAAHRAVLAARSPVFAAMFHTDMIESRSRRVQVDDVPANVFDVFLRFVYTGQLAHGADDDELLRVADRYQVETLRRLCEEAAHHDDAEECGALIVEALM